MSVIHVQGLRSLRGEINIQGSKNAVLPVMAASLLHRGTTVINNVPRIQDVSCMMGILEYLGCVCTLDGHTLTIDTREMASTRIPDSQVKQMRSSIMLLGPLLGRLKAAVTCRPGGCCIGKRPIDLHLYALRRMGADIRLEGERITASTIGLKGAEIAFAYPSVGATENALMAAVAAKGTTRISGAAKEPEIMELCRFLTGMGAVIDGIGTDILVIRGQQPLRDTVFDVAGDRIVAGTYLGAVLAAGGDVMLRHAPAHHMEEVIDTARRMGAEIVVCPEGVQVCMKSRPGPVEIRTGPYPEFPTDLQSVMMAVAAVADGVSRIEETVFEGRFGTVKELQKLGAHIIIKDRTATITGTWPLTGETVCARDLRGGAALVVAGLACDGAATITGYSHIHRGYEDICRDLGGLGAVMELDTKVRETGKTEERLGWENHWKKRREQV